MDFTQLIIVLSLLSFIFVGLLVKKSSTASYSDFTMNKKGLNWFVIATGISMTFAGGAAILTTASIGYMFKWYALIDPLALMVGLLIVLFLYNIYKNDSGTTISDLLSAHDKKLTVLIGVITSFTFLLIVAANFVALSKLLSPYFPNINPSIIKFVVSTLVFSYVFWGGFNSVTKTDILQYALIFALLVVPLFFFLIENHDQLTPSFVSHQFVPMPLDYIVLFSIPVLFTPLSQDINLRIKSAKSTAHGKIGLMMGGIFYFTITLSVAFVGVYLGNHNMELSDPEQAVPLFFKEHFPKVGFFAIIASLSAIISSLDSYILNSIISVSNDIIKPLSKSQNQASKNIKIASFITYVVAMMIALFFNKILALTLTSLLIYISVLSPIALANKLKISEKKIFIGSLINIGVIILVEVMRFSLSPKALIYPLIGCFVMLILKMFEFLTARR